MKELKIFSILTIGTLLLMPNFNNNIIKAENKISVNEDSEIAAEERISNIYRDLDTYVSKSVIDSLILKIKNNIETEADMVGSIPLQIIEKNNETIKIYKDGSYIKTGMKTMDGSVFRYLDGVSCGSGYCSAHNGHVYKKVNGGEIGFYAAFEFGKGQQGNYAIIRSVWSGYTHGGGRVTGGPSITGPNNGIYYASMSAYINGQHQSITLSVGPSGTNVY